MLQYINSAYVIFEELLFPIKSVRMLAKNKLITTKYQWLIFFRLKTDKI